MSANPSQSSKGRVSSWLSRRFKKHDSSAIAPLPATPRLTSNSTRSLDLPTHVADTDASPPPVSSRPSESNTLIPSTTDTVSLYPSPSVSPSPQPSPYSTGRQELPNQQHANTSSSLSVFPSASTSSPLLLSGYSAERVDGTSHQPDSYLSSPSASHLPSPSSATAPSTASYMCAAPSPDHLSSQNYLSTPPAPSTPPHLPLRPTLSYQGNNNMFGGAHDFVMSNPVFNDYSTPGDNFMEKLLQETIIGAEFDSSARDPPPRCHPGTRLAIIQRCLDFVTQCHDKERLRWVVGPAGVGKSAVMQMVLETAPDDVVSVSIFFSINGRQDGSKIILTIAYQLAAKCGPYRQFVRDQITLDPSFLRKSLPVQFKKFIVEPFILKRIFEPSRRFMVVLDGLDECDDPAIQQGLLELISNFCITYPTSPIVWIVASRPEPHITSFFDNPEIRPAYTKEEMVVDSDQACEDVQRYLRDELKKIKLANPTLRHKHEWPLEHEFTNIASAAGGLFAYAATVTRYIRNSTHGGPAAQLRRVLETIDATTKDHVAGRDHPMDRLDALYKRILSSIPDNVMINTRKLLLIFRVYPFDRFGFRMICNTLGLTEDDAYDAISYLHAVMNIPEPDKADEKLSFYHKSFGDFLSDFNRSGFSHDFQSEVAQLSEQTIVKIMGELLDLPDGVPGSESIDVAGGVINGYCENMSLSWPGDERFEMTDKEVRIELYKKLLFWVKNSISNHNCSFIKSISCFHALTMHFMVLKSDFPFYRLREYAFDEFRDELRRLGKLKQVALRRLDYAAICEEVELQFTSCGESKIEISNSLDLSCKHEREDLDGLVRGRGWSTRFKRYQSVDLGIVGDEDANIPRFHAVAFYEGHRDWSGVYFQGSQSVTACNHCSKRLALYFMNNQDQLATVFVTSTQMSFVEVSFVDPDDGVSQWRYRFFHSGPPASTDV